MAPASKAGEAHWRVAMFEIGRPPVVMETPHGSHLGAWFAALPRLMKDAFEPGVTWRAIRVPGHSTVQDHDFAEWHADPLET